MKVYAAINKVQASLAKTGISKDRKNQQQGYNFRGIDDVYNVLSPLLAETGLCILPRVLSRECVERTTAKGGAIFYVTVEAEFDFVCAEDGSKHTVKTYGEAMDSADKATNKAMSAAYKYAAFQAFAIPTEGDNDADAVTHEVKPASKVTPTAGAWESLKHDQQTRLIDILADVKAHLAQGDDWGAYEALETANLNDTEKTALWSKLDSKQRAAIKEKGRAERQSKEERNIAAEAITQL